MKEITIQVPDGKRAEWVNGVLTLIDEEVKDNRPVTERIKTFEDACEELNRRVLEGDEMAGNLLADYESNADNITCKQTLAYMRLSIIVAALNEGWEPKFEKGEHLYYPWFSFCTKEAYDKFAYKEKEHYVIRSSDSRADYGVVFVDVRADVSCSYANIGLRLTFKTLKLARYAGKQFVEEWVGFVFNPRTEN